MTILARSCIAKATRYFAQAFAGYMRAIKAAIADREEIVGRVLAGLSIAFEPSFAFHYATKLTN